MVVNRTPCGDPVMDFQPEPIIIAAQALNGMLLPFVIIFLLFIMNDNLIMDAKTINRNGQNIIMLIIVLFTCYLGLFNIYKALQRTFDLSWDISAVMIFVRPI